MATIRFDDFAQFSLWACGGCDNHKCNNMPFNCDYAVAKCFTAIDAGYDVELGNFKIRPITQKGGEQ